MSGPPALVPPSSFTERAAGPGLLAVLLEHARRSPEDPVLFHPEGLDVRWRSWRSLMDQVAGGAAALRAASVEVGARVAYRWRCHPDAVAADLAVQAAGGVAVPVCEPGEAATAGCVARLALPEEEASDWQAPGTVSAVALPPAEAPWAREARRGSPPEVPVPAGGGAWVRDDGEPRELSAGVTAAAARELGARIESAAAEADAAAGGRRRGGREIALVHLDLRSAGARALLSWGLLSGATLYLEPDPRSVPASTAWARPTLVAAGAPSLVELARQLRRREESRLGKLLRRGRPPHPFGRLRLLVVLGGGRLPVGDIPFWAERGVVVLRG